MKEIYKQKINKKLVMPALMFMRQEKSSGIVLGIAVIIALLLANSPWREQYFESLNITWGLFSTEDLISTSLWNIGLTMG